jgi:D-alanyl-D-alanine carboxypeptidase (penicillin-binding protein 5/6)
MIAGSEEDFVEMMNEKCLQLGLKNTHFENTTGLHSENHYTTMKEMAIIMKYAMENDLCAEVLTTDQYTTSQTLEHPEGIKLTSSLFCRITGEEEEGMLVLGGKTGYTDHARQCLAEYIIKDGKTYIVITAGGTSKWHPIEDGYYLCENFGGK